MSEGRNRRSLKNLALTERFHFAYFGNWMIANVILLATSFGLAVGIIQLTPAEVLTQDPSELMFWSAGAAVLLSGLVVLFGSLSAHRIGGVHLKIEGAFEAVGEGDFSTRLHFRTSDNLESVGQGFNEMMESIQEDVSPPHYQHEETSPAGKKRSPANFKLTREHHVPYMGIWLLTTMSLTFLTQRCALSFLAAYSLRNMSVTATDAALWVNLIATFLYLYSIYAAIKNAHRIAGVHIKLRNTFGRVKAGDRGLVLRFRSSDKLKPLESAFARMLESIIRHEGGTVAAEVPS